MFKTPLENLKKLANVIQSNKCYVHADNRGMIFRFVVGEEIAPPILVDEQLASQLHGMIGEFLQYMANQRQVAADAAAKEQATNDQPK